jgi:AraC-like DNA-binding protein
MTNRAVTNRIESSRLSSAVFWVKGIVTALKQEDLDVPALIREAGLNPIALDNPDARVPTETVSRLWRLAVERSGNPAAGLAGAMVPKPSIFDVVGYAMMSSPDLRGVLERAARYIRIVSDAATLNVTTNHDGYRLCLELLGGDDEVPWQRYCFDLMSVLSFLRWIMEGDLQALALELRASTNDAHQCQTASGCQLRFGAEVNALLFAPADVARPLPTAHAELASVHERIASEYLARLDRSETVARVRAAILERLADGRPQRAKVARALGMSERTLQRRVEAIGSSFRLLLDETHKEMARTYIERHDLSLAEVAYLLGFNDQSSLFRATQRWFGSSPRQYRLQSAAASERHA